MHPGEGHSCITLNGVGGAVLENISLDNLHLIFAGGGTSAEGARRDLPEIAGEYFMLGPMPAYGLYARNVRGLSLNNIRFQVATPDLRPAVILDHVEDAAVNGLSVEGNTGAESVLRFMDSKVRKTQESLSTAGICQSCHAGRLQMQRYRENRNAENLSLV